MCRSLEWKHLGFFGRIFGNLCTTLTNPSSFGPNLGDGRQHFMVEVGQLVFRCYPSLDRSFEQTLMIPKVLAGGVSVKTRDSKDSENRHLAVLGLSSMCIPHPIFRTCLFSLPDNRLSAKLAGGAQEGPASTSGRRSTQVLQRLARCAQSLIFAGRSLRSF